MRRSHLLLVGCALLVVTAGCIAWPGTGERSLSLGVANVSEHSANESVKVNATLTMNGHIGVEYRIEEVDVCFLDSEDREMAVAEAGTITNRQRGVNVTATMPEQPTEIVIGYEDVDTEADFDVDGLRRTDAGVYEERPQNGPLC